MYIYIAEYFTSANISHSNYINNCVRTNIRTQWMNGDVNKQNIQTLQRLRLTHCKLHFFYIPWYSPNSSVHRPSVPYLLSSWMKTTSVASASSAF